MGNNIEYPILIVQEKNISHFDYANIIFVDYNLSADINGRWTN